MPKGTKEIAADSTTRVEKAKERIWPDVGWTEPTVSDRVKVPKKDLLPGAVSDEVKVPKKDLLPGAVVSSTSSSSQSIPTTRSIPVSDGTLEYPLDEAELSIMAGNAGTYYMYLT